MATTFNVFFLGTGPFLDPTEGNELAENAGALVGTTFGGPGDPLVDHIQSFSPGSTGFGAGNATAYDSNNSVTNDTFRINGGPDQTMDTTVGYNATITYVDGTTATITAVVFQDTAGRLYLAPEGTANADQAALESKPIQSLTLTSVGNDTAVLGADRVAGTYAVCFTGGTRIRTPGGDRLIDDLRVGDPVSTLDSGPQPVRWICRRSYGGTGLVLHPALRPVLIRSGVLGAVRDLLVSPQRGLLVTATGLGRARHLAEEGFPGIRTAHGRRSVTYVHLLFDAHQIIFANGVASESFYPGPMAHRKLEPTAREQLSDLLPGLRGAAPVADVYGPRARRVLDRKAIRALLSGAAGCPVLCGEQR